jgi:hypothetical protein
MDMTLNEDSIDAVFKITNTTAGTDALTEAMDGLRDGFSIELAVDDYIMQKDGTMRVLAGELTGVALVTEPAVRSARVSEVAATEGEEVAEETFRFHSGRGSNTNNRRRRSGQHRHKRGNRRDGRSCSVNNSRSEANRRRIIHQATLRVHSC